MWRLHRVCENEEKVDTSPMGKRPREFDLLYVKIMTTRFAERGHRDATQGEKRADLMDKV